MTKLDKSEVCDEETRNRFFPGEGVSNLLSVAMINVMAKSNSKSNSEEKAYR